MSQFFKGVALFIGVCCLVWVGVLWRWQATQRDMSSADIVLYLGLLPVVVFVLLVLGRKAFLAASVRADAKASAAAAAAAATTSGGAAGATAAGQTTGDDAARRATLQVLSAQVCTPAADTVTGLETACLDGQPRPEPDTELRDDEGLPVMCARAAELPLDDTAELWERALDSVRASRPEWATQDPDEAVRRALAALASPLRQALSTLQAWPEALGVQTPSDAAPHGRHEATADGPRLRVLPGWPTHWSEFEQAVARAALQAMAEDTLQGLVAPQRVVWMANQATGATAHWLAVDTLFQGLLREQRSDVVLVTACHSNLSERRIEHLQREQRLYTAQHPRAQMPGEAAAALLLAPPSWPANPEAHEPAVRLHRPAVGQRDKPVDAAGKVGSALLENLAGQALEVAGVAAAEVLALCSDADQHTARATELFGALLALLPHLDAAEDVRLLGPVQGSGDATTVLLTVALAASQATKREGPCLALSVDDAQARLALVARPAPLPPAPSDTPGAA